MARFHFFLFILCLCGLSLGGAVAAGAESAQEGKTAKKRVPLSERIKHIIVLMEENRSYDHLMGWFNRSDNGLKGTEYNLVNVTDTSSPKVIVSADAPYLNDCDPNHGYPATTYKLFGPTAIMAANLTDPTMCGFVEWERDFDGQKDPSLHFCDVMEGFKPENLPVWTALSEEFGFFDKFFCSVPGPTWPNRLFMLAASSAGLTETIPWYRLQVGELFPLRTIFDQVGDAGGEWKYYYSDTPWELMIQSLAHNPEHIFDLETFYRDAAEGTLPHFAFVNPRAGINMTTLEGSNDMHPDHDVRLSEALYKRLYEALRASPQWNETLFIVTFDEHGGFYDHIQPPQPIPSPGDYTFPSYPDEFYFNRSGIRIPTLMASPWLPKGFVVSDPPEAQKPAPNSAYELTSIMATVRKLLPFMSDTQPLTGRDAWAATFEHIFDVLDEPRTDCPMHLPDPVPPATSPPQEGDVKLSARGLPKHRPHDPFAEGLQAVNHLQQDIIAVHAHLAGVEYPAHVTTQSEVSEWARRHYQIHRERTLRWKDSKSNSAVNLTVGVLPYGVDALTCHWDWNRNASVSFQTLSVRINDTDYCLDSGNARVGEPVTISMCYPSRNPANNRDLSQQWVFTPTNSIRPHAAQDLCVTEHWLGSGLSLLTLEKCDGGVGQHFAYMGNAPGMGQPPSEEGTHHIYEGDDLSYFCVTAATN